MVVAALFSVNLWGFLFGGWRNGRDYFDPPATGGQEKSGLFPQTFYARAGATVEVDYDATVERGRFSLWVQQRKQRLDGPVWGRIDTPDSGPGGRSFTIGETGLYAIRIGGASVRGSRGYDVRYRVRWRIH